MNCVAFYLLWYCAKNASTMPRRYDMWNLREDKKAILSFHVTHEAAVKCILLLFSFAHNDIKIISFIYFLR